MGLNSQEILAMSSVSYKICMSFGVLHVDNDDIYIGKDNVST